MICKNCSCWLPGRDFLCTCCGAFSETSHYRTSLFWLVATVIVLVVAANCYLALIVARVFPRASSQQKANGLAIKADKSLEIVAARLVRAGR